MPFYPVSFNSTSVHVRQLFYVVIRDSWVSRLVLHLSVCEIAFPHPSISGFWKISLSSQTFWNASLPIGCSIVKAKAISVVIVSYVWLSGRKCDSVELELNWMEVEQRLSKMQLVRKAAEQYHRLMDRSRPTLSSNKLNSTNVIQQVSFTVASMSSFQWRNTEFASLCVVLTSWPLLVSFILECKRTQSVCQWINHHFGSFESRPSIVHQIDSVKQKKAGSLQLKFHDQDSIFHLFVIKGF